MARLTLPSSLLTAQELSYPGRKPVGPLQIDRNNRFAGRVQFAAILSNSVKDLVSGDMPELVRQYDSSPVPDGFNFIQGDANFSPGRDSLRYRAKISAKNSKLTLVLKFKVGAQSGGNYQRVVDTKTNSAAVDGVFVAQRNRSNIVATSGNSSTIGEVPVVLDSGWMNTVLVYDGAALKSYSFDGSSVDSVVSAITDVPTEVTIGHNTGDSDYGYYGTIAHVIAISGTVNKSEAMSLIHDPYQIAAPVSSQFIFPAVYIPPVYLADSILDGGLGYMKNNITERYICVGNPTDRASAIAASVCSLTGLTPASFTDPVDGDTSGRKITKLVESGDIVESSGMGDTVCYCSATYLIWRTDVESPQLLTAGGTVNTTAHDHENLDAI